MDLVEHAENLCGDDAPQPLVCGDVESLNPFGALEHPVKRRCLAEVEDFLLVSKVVVEAPLGHPEIVGDGPHTGAPCPMLPEGTGRALQDGDSPVRRPSLTARDSVGGRAGIFLF